MCANAFLPGLAREDSAVQAAIQDVDQGEGNDLELTDSRTSIEEDEGRRLLPIPEIAAPIVSAISTAELADSPTPPSSSSPEAHYHAVLSLTISRISSIGVALGFFAGVSVLALLIIPVTLMGGTTSSLRLAVGVSAIWWAVFTVPAWMGLPNGHNSGQSKSGIGLGQGWRRVGGMIRPSEIRQLPNLFTFLLAWIFLSDGRSTPLIFEVMEAELIDRVSYHNIYSHPLRIVHTRNESTQNHPYRSPSPTSRRHLVCPSPESTEQTGNIESETSLMDHTPSRGYSDICLYWVNITFWGIEDRGGNVCGCYMVRIGESG